MKQGKVYLVGAGPGDPGLITKKGLDCLSQAEVVVYDRLLDEKLIEMIPATAEKIYVGKGSGEHTKEQDEINQILVDWAKKGKVVVRLKGGDPFVLGRGGEEGEVLRENGLSFEVVPGVTSAVAVPAYAGIPVTHRQFASSFAVITGHEDSSKDESSIDWAKLATGVDTLVFLMGLRNMPHIVKQLIENGRSADTPVAVIKDGTLPTQKVVTGDLAGIVNEVRNHRLSPPAVVVVGEVIRLRDKLRWFDNRPLFGKRVLVTRARHQASALSRLLSEHGARPIELPSIDIKTKLSSDELDEAIRNLGRYHWVVFTSVNGVEAFFQRLKSLNLDSRALNNLKIGAIGPATAKALETRGLIPDYIPEVYTGRGYLDGLDKHEISGRRFLLPRADIADKELSDGLLQLGAEVQEIPVYQTVPATDAIARARTMLLSGEVDVITFTSSSTVSNLVAAFGHEPLPLNGTRVACIGPKTAETAIKAGLSVDIVASEHTIPGLVTAVEKYFEEVTR